MEKVKRENIGEFLFDKQLTLLNINRMAIIDYDDWRRRFPMTRNQYTEFREDAIKLMMKTFKCSKNKAKDNFNWYWEQFGVRIYR